MISERKEKVYELVIRFWMPGAVYFIIGWGMNLGGNALVEHILILAFVIAIANVIIVNPVINQMLNIETKRYGEISLNKKLLSRLLEFLKAFGVVLLVFFTYRIIGTIWMIIAVEPFLFATFYVMHYYLIRFITTKVRGLLRK